MTVNNPKGTNQNFRHYEDTTGRREFSLSCRNGIIGKEHTMYHTCLNVCYFVLNYLHNKPFKEILSLYQMREFLKGLAIYLMLQIWWGGHYLVPPNPTG